ncbi:hypothetical protein CWB76_20030, partial [Pseudoalteromonas sp. S1609]
NYVLIQDIYKSYKYSKNPYHTNTRPRGFLTNHSPNIVKEIIKKFRVNQRNNANQKKTEHKTKNSNFNTTYDNETFINIFSDKEARLFFSDFILFVEG